MYTKYLDSKLKSLKPGQRCLYEDLGLSFPLKKRYAPITAYDSNILSKYYDAYKNSEDRLESTEVRSRVLNTLISLTNRDCSILIKIFYNEEPLHDIAFELGVSRDSIYLLRQRALKNFKKIYLKSI